MKVLKIITIVSLFLVIGYIISDKNIAISNEGHLKELKLLVKQMPNNWYRDQRIYPQKSIDMEAFQNAIRYKKEQNRKSSDRVALKWKLVGPTNIGGRITDVEVSNTNPPIIYAGSAAGGIFKTTESSEIWEPISDLSMDMSIGDIAIAPSNQKLLYVGTGEPNGGGGSLSYDGSGIFKSIDGGENWVHKGLVDIGSVGKVLIHPTNPDICFVGAMGTLFKKSTSRGVYRTLDGGDNWEKVLYFNDSIGVIDMAINPIDPSIIYAATWERTRSVNNSNYQGTGSGIYKSIDGGSTWERLVDGLPDRAGRIGISISPSHPNILYANIADPWTKRLEGVYKTENAGESWLRKNSQSIEDTPYMWWFGGVFVHPTDPDIVYINSLDMFKTVDGGENWQISFAGVHADQHSVGYFPNEPEKLVIGNDGGVYISSNGGINHQKMNGLPVSQFYTCEIDNQDPTAIYGGTQDNGTLRTLKGKTDDWKRIFGGDGFRVIVNPENSNKIYVEYQYGNIFYSDDRGDFFNYINPNIDNSERQNWNTPFTLDPLEPNTIYYGTNLLRVSYNEGQDWEIISPDLTKNQNIGNLPHGTITTISVSPIDNGIIWVGTDDGNIQVSNDYGETWTLVSSSLPNRWVTSIKSDPNNKNNAYATFSGYKFGEDNGHVFYTETQGTDWVDIGTELPDIPINDIIINSINHDLYIATDIGVFSSDDNGNSWELLGDELPDIGIMNLDYHAPTDKLVAATFGRGIYQLTLDTHVAIEEEATPKKGLKVFPNPFVNQITLLLQNKKILNDYILYIYNINGALVYKQDKVYNGLKINTSNLPSGVYTMSLKHNNNNNKIESLKIFK